MIAASKPLPENSFWPSTAGEQRRSGRAGRHPRCSVQLACSPAGGSPPTSSRLMSAPNRRMRRDQCFACSCSAASLQQSQQPAGAPRRCAPARPALAAALSCCVALMPCSSPPSASPAAFHGSPTAIAVPVANSAPVDATGAWALTAPDNAAWHDGTERNHVDLLRAQRALGDPGGEKPRPFAQLVAGLEDQSGVAWFIAARGAVALLCGWVIGYERRSAHSLAGTRVCSLVSLGTCMLVSIALASPAATEGIGRAVASAATSVGFLGANVLNSRRTFRKGLTTSCAIWLSAACGVGKRAVSGADVAGWARVQAVPDSRPCSPLRCTSCELGPAPHGSGVRAADCLHQPLSKTRQLAPIYCPLGRGSVA
jgi:hypothetical protein